MSTTVPECTERERELGAIIDSYNEVTEQLKRSHDRLAEEVQHLREELARKNAELRRRERLAALGEMAAGVAHEIRNPLGGIQLFSSLLARDLQDRPAQLLMVEKVSKCVGAMERIVADILEFGRPSTPSPAPVDLGVLVRECVELAASRTRQTAVTIEALDGIADISLIADAALLQRALLNLLVNAIEAVASNSDGPGTAAVRIRADRGTAGRVAIHVEDDGPGIPADLMDRIFNPFFTTKDGGTGLGLAIVHQIAETLGGSVRAANRPSGRGAVFTLQIPAGPEIGLVGDSTRRARPRAPVAGSPPAGMRTLNPCREEVV
jgi:signal transduction histidine kinase